MSYCDTNPGICPWVHDDETIEMILDSGSSQKIDSEQDVFKIDSESVSPEFCDSVTQANQSSLSLEFHEKVTQVNQSSMNYFFETNCIPDWL